MTKRHWYPSTNWFITSSSSCTFPSSIFFLSSSTLPFLDLQFFSVKKISFVFNQSGTNPHNQLRDLTKETNIFFVFENGCCCGEEQGPTTSSRRRSKRSEQSHPETSGLRRQRPRTWFSTDKFLAKVSKYLYTYLKVAIFDGRWDT